MKRFFSTLTFAAAFCGVASADDIPLRNWAVPPQGSSSLSTLADVGYPAIFVGVTPCRVADTRLAAGAYGGPILAAGVPRTFDIVASGCTGIPAGVSAFSLNFTAVTATGNGMLLAWPTGGSQPSISVLNYVTGQTIANAAIVPAGSGTSITVVAGVHATNLIIDINGYFIGGGGNLNSGEQLSIGTDIGGQAAIVGYNWSSTDGSHGVGGYEGGTGKVHGVQGQISDAAGPASSGVYGIGAATTARSSGVMGETSGTAFNSAGVYGRATSNVPDVAGVIGETNSSWSNASGVLGLAFSSGATAGIFSNVGGGGLVYLANGSAGVYTNGSISGTSLSISGLPKNFVAPHPLDPSKQIVYAAIEGPSADVFFRGTTHLVNGSALIQVPEHFRLTAREDSYMATVTALGERSSLWVESQGPDGIVVKGSGAAAFNYVVYAERDETRDQQPVRENVYFVPEHLAKLGLLKTLPARTIALLVKNGTLHPDGTFNEATARRLGWEIPGEGKAR